MSWQHEEIRLLVERRLLRVKHRPGKDDVGRQGHLAVGRGRSLRDGEPEPGGLGEKFCLVTSLVGAGNDQMPRLSDTVARGAACVEMLQPRPGIQKVHQSLLRMNTGHKDRHPLAVARRGTSTVRRRLGNINTERGEDDRLPQPHSPNILYLGFGGCVNQRCCSQVTILVEHPRHLFLEPFLR